MWAHSGKLDMNGRPFKCDALQTSLFDQFFPDIVYNEDNEATQYGPYSPAEIEIISRNIEKQAEQQWI